jgi:hypothetical protein
LWELVLVDKIEDEVEVILYCGYFTFDKGGEEVNQVSVDTGAFVLGSVKDSVADVTREGVGLVWRCGGVEVWRVGVDGCVAEQVVCTIC